MISSMPMLLQLRDDTNSFIVRVEVNLTEVNSRFRGTTTMRLVFNTTLTVDVPPNDDALRRAFIELVTQSARTVYGPAAMLAKSKPIFKLTITDRSGMADLPMFEDEPTS